MKRSALIGICVLLSSFALAQTHWIKSYGNSGYDFGRDIQQTVDTGYIATGSSSSFGADNADAFLLKLDSLGNFIWSYNYGGPGSEWGESVTATLDSGFALGGFSNTTTLGDFDFYLVKTNHSGVPEWEKRYGGSDWDKCRAIVQLPDSGYVMVGETYSYGSGLLDGYIIRTDKVGDTIWTRVYGGAEDDYFNAVVLDGDSLFVAGGTESFGAGGTDGWMLKLDTLGNFGWEKFVGYPELDYFSSIDFIDTVYTLGGTQSPDFNTYQNDFWVYQMSTDGTIVYGDTSWTGDQFGIDIAYDAVVDTLTRDIFYGGSTTSWGTFDISDDVPEFFISKMTPNYAWLPYVQNFGMVGPDAIYAMDFCLDRGLVAIGDSDFLSTGGSNVFVIRIDQPNTFGFLPDLLNTIDYDSITNSMEELTEIINFYPNPVQEELNFTQNIEDAYILDMTGKIMLQVTEPSQQIDMSGLAPGIYLLNCRVEGTRYSAKLIKK